MRKLMKYSCMVLVTASCIAAATVTAPVHADTISPAPACPGVSPCHNVRVSVKVPTGSGYNWACLGKTNWVGSYHSWVIHVGLNPVDATGRTFWGRAWIGQGGGGMFPYYDIAQRSVVACD